MLFGVQVYKDGMSPGVWSIRVFSFLHSFRRSPLPPPFRTLSHLEHWALRTNTWKVLPCLPVSLLSSQGQACISPGPSPTCLPSVHRFAGHRSRLGKEETDFWAKLHTSKETKNLPAAGVGSATGRDTHHPGDCSHHLPGTVLLPPTGGE